MTQIAKANPGLALRLALAPDDSTRRDEFRSTLDRWLENKSFQGPQKVVSALEYLGCAVSWGDFDAQTCVTTSAELARITDERHAIVHRGQKPYIKRQLTGEAVGLIEAMAKLIDSRVITSLKP